MIAKCILAAFLLVYLAAAPALADSQTPAPNPTPTTASALTPEEATRALAVLNDADQRAKLIDTLQAISKASPPARAATPAPAPAPTPTLSLKPDSLGAELVLQAAGWAKEFSDELIAVARTVADVPALGRGLVSLASDPYARATALDATWRFALAFVCALGAEALLARALRRPREALDASHRVAREDAAAAAREGPAGPNPADRFPLAHRLPLALLRLILWLIPIGAFTAVGLLVLAAEVDAESSTRLLVLEGLKAYVLCRLIDACARMLASSSNSHLRLLRVDDQTAAYIEVWTRRIVVVAVVGGSFGESLQLLGASARLHYVLAKFLAFILNLFLLTIVLQCRVNLAAWIRGAPGAHGPFATVRNRLADVWHVIAIAFILALWFAWAARFQEGLSRTLQMLMFSGAVLLVARLFAIAALGLLDRLFRVNREFASHFPGLESRANRYYPLLRAVVSLAIAGVGGVALLEVWGVDAVAWFHGDAVGARLVSALTTIAVAAAVGAAIWEAVNAAMDQHLERLEHEARIARAARLRTLLPMLRSALLISILVVFALTALSEIGVNTAPLLAGAGIVGIAIGFGSQKLVQDLITGLFLLLENAIQVGDFVTVAGLSGSVENLSIRTLRLRAGDGSVHIVPFSSVTSVTNANRGIGNAAVSVTVPFDEDTDRVGQTLKRIASEMKQEAQFRSVMLSELQLWGVDKLDGYSATLAGQIVCTDSGRWDVQREFNRRLKQAFQAEGLKMAPPAAPVVIQQNLSLARAAEGDEDPRPNAHNGATNSRPS